MTFLDPIKAEVSTIELVFHIIALDSGVYPDSHKKITCSQVAQCVYGECKYLPKCPRGCMGAHANEDWLTENLPPTTGAEYGEYI